MRDPNHCKRLPHIHKRNMAQSSIYMRSKRACVHAMQCNAVEYTRSWEGLGQHKHSVIGQAGESVQPGGIYRVLHVTGYRNVSTRFFFIVTSRHFTSTTHMYMYILILQHQTTDGRATRLQQLTLYQQQRLVSGTTDGRAARLQHSQPAEAPSVGDDRAV